MGFGRAGHHIGEKSGVSAQRKPCGFVSCDARAPAPLCWAVVLQSSELRTKGSCWAGAAQPLAWQGQGRERANTEGRRAQPAARWGLVLLCKALPSWGARLRVPARSPVACFKLAAPSARRWLPQKLFPLHAKFFLPPSRARRSDAGGCTQGSPHLAKRRGGTRGNDLWSPFPREEHCPYKEFNGWRIPQIPPKRVPFGPWQGRCPHRSSASR